MTGCQECGHIFNINCFFLQRSSICDTVRSFSMQNVFGFCSRKEKPSISTAQGERQPPSDGPQTNIFLCITHRQTLRTHTQADTQIQTQKHTQEGCDVCRCKDAAMNPKHDRVIAEKKITINHD